MASHAEVTIAMKPIFNMPYFHIFRIYINGKLGRFYIVIYRYLLAFGKQGVEFVRFQRFTLDG